ncbi:dCTP deaminase [Candidatus Dojkabacteria bacterium]|nr:dCTP deaminase [Candidatus Dojkabacteria bacterium]
MGLLVDQKIKEYIAAGNIKIDPFNNKNIGPSAYYFSLGPIILIPKSNQIATLSGGKDPEYERIDITDSPYTIKPKEFILAQTLEKITLAQNIAMLIDGRTTTARLGLSIHQSATLIHPGHKDSIITLEIFNAGIFDIVIKLGDKIGKGIFFLSDTSAEQAYANVGTYKTQTEPMGADLPPFDDCS